MGVEWIFNMDMQNFHQNPHKEKNPYNVFTSSAPAVSGDRAGDDDEPSLQHHPQCPGRPGQSHTSHQ